LAYFMVCVFPFWYVVPRTVWQSCLQGCLMVYFKPKIPIFINFESPWSEQFWYIL
jgi:hypothetical protein